MLRLARIAAIFYFGCILVASLSEAKIDPETAVGVWLFDEGTGNDTKDSSGKGHHGQINGAKWKNGKFGKGLEFNGEQGVEIKSTPELQAGNQLTMMAWFYATKIDDWRQLIAKSDEYLLTIMDQGLANVIGGDTPVSPIGMLASTWSKLKYK